MPKKKRPYKQPKDSAESAAEDPAAHYLITPTQENKNQRLELRLTTFQKEFINKAAIVSGFKNVSDYVLHIAINDSRTVIREQQLLDLSVRDRAAFMKALQNPPAPGHALKRATVKYKSFQKDK